MALRMLPFLLLLGSALAQFPQTLDYGLFWVGYGNVLSRTSFYDPAKPTFIIIHGWQKDTVTRGFRTTLNYRQNDPTYGLDVNEADAWLNAGWNVGMFQWSQFADESEVKDAEAKIWTNAGPQGMRWRRADGSYAVDSYASSRSVTQLAYEAVVNSMGSWTGNNLRLAGHSLGAQLAITLAQSLSNAVDSGQLASRFRPKRVALLDHFFSQDGKSYLNGKWTGERAREIVPVLKGKGVLFETYRSSATSSNGFIGDENVGLNKMTVFTEIKPWYIPGTNVGAKHIAMFDLYPLSFAYAAPKEYTWGLFSGYSATGRVGAYASTSDARLQDLESETTSSCSRFRRWQIDSGQSGSLGQGVWSIPTGDDTVERKCW